MDLVKTSTKVILRAVIIFLFANPVYGQTKTMTVADAMSHVHMLSFGYNQSGLRDEPFVKCTSPVANLRPTEQKVCGTSSTPVEAKDRLTRPGGPCGYGWVIFLCVPN